MDSTSALHNRRVLRYYESQKKLFSAFAMRKRIRQQIVPKTTCPRARIAQATVRSVDLYYTATIKLGVFYRPTMPRPAGSGPTTSSEWGRSRSGATPPTAKSGFRRRTNTPQKMPTSTTDTRRSVGGGALALRMCLL